MRLSYPEYNIELPLKENIIWVIYVENQNEFTRMVSDLWRQGDGQDGSWILYDADKELSISKAMIVNINPLAIDCNDRKLLKTLYQDIAEDVRDNLNQEYGTANNQMVSFIDWMIMRQPYNIDFNPLIDVTEICKTYEVKFVENFDSLLEQIVTYIKLWHKVSHINVFCFVNLKSYLSYEDLQKLYEMILYEHVQLVLIEAKYQEKIANEYVKILDKDRCLIDI